MEDPTLDLQSAGPPRTELPASAPQRGDTIGRYLVVDVLGIGGMGIVYKAFDPVLNRAIALKVLLLGDERLSADDSIDRRRNRALREAQALAQLTHPNVVAIYDVGMSDERLFMAMELIEGTTLAALLKEKKASRAELLALLGAAGQGLWAAHEHGIIHRDFKPANVVVGNDGRVRVIDFGLARADEHALELPLPPGPLLDARGSLNSEVTQAGLVLGTPMYMAPEQKEGAALDATADQFSFAVVAWEALYGQRPFAGDTADDVAENARARNLRRPGGASVPMWIDAILARALSADPKARFSSMAELLRALGDDPDERRRRGRVVRARQAVGALALAAIAGSAFVAWRSRSAAEQICRGADQKLVGVWDERVRDTVDKAFAATGKSFAARAAVGVRGALDRYAAAWAAMHTDACEASSVRHDQSAEVMTLRMSCLQHRMSELAATSALLVKADAAVVEHAQEIAEKLTPIASCGDIALLTAAIAPPRDAAGRAAVDAERDALGRAKVLSDAGRGAEALPIAEASVARARALAYRPLEAEAENRRGQILYELGRYEDSAKAHRAAFLAALASRHSEVELRAATALIVGSSIGLSRPVEAEQWSEIAHALLESRPPDPEAEARWLNDTGVHYLNNGGYGKALDYISRGLAIRETLTIPNAPRLVATSLLDLGVVEDELGNQDKARQHYERAIAILEKDLGPTHPALGSPINNLGILAWEEGRFDDAEALYKRAFRIEADTYGSETPGAALMLVNFALLYHDMAERDPKREVEALETYRRSLALAEKVYGKNHTMVVWSLGGLGRLAAQHGRADEARADFERVLAICGADRCRGEEKHALAEADFGLAKLGDRRGRTLALEARGFLQQIKSVTAKRRLGEVEAWLAAHGGLPAPSLAVADPGDR